MVKKLLFLLVVFLLGVGGGIWAQVFLLPAFAADSRFQDIQFVQDWNARTVILRPTEQVVITESKALERVVKRFESSVVSLQNSFGANLGSGLIYTSDGLIVTLASVAPTGVLISLNDKEEPLPAQVIKRDWNNNLALLKVEKTSLQTASFLQDVVVGEKILIVGKNPSIFVAEGIIQNIGKKLSTTVWEDKKLFNGAPVFEMEGKVLGLATLSSTGRIEVISSTQLREFLGI